MRQLERFCKDSRMLLYRFCEGSGFGSKSKAHGCRFGA